MNITGAITAGAAGLAAILSAVNLYVSGRRELNKWTRETLVETYALFLDASFKHGGACRKVVKESNTKEERDRLRSTVQAEHDTENAALTRLRLLAPPQVVNDAATLLESEYRLAESCFIEPPRADDFDSLLKPVRQSRARFLESARLALGLRETAGTGYLGSNFSWRVLRANLNQEIEHGKEEEENPGPS